MGSFVNCGLMSRAVRSLKTCTAPLCCWLCLIAQLPAAEKETEIIAGRSLADWQAVMSRLELRDPASQAYVPGLIELMKSDQVPWMTRRQAALTLGRLGPLARDAVPQILAQIRVVNPEEPEVSPQRWALSSLALYGREAHSAAPQLIALLNEKASSVITRLGCVEALSQIGSASPRAIPALWQTLERGLAIDADEFEQEVAIGAAEALGMVGSDAGPAVPVLIRAAQSADDDLARESLRALGKIGPRASDAQPLLLDVMLTADSPVLRDVAMTSLGQTGSTAWPLIEPLFQLDDAEVRERAVTVVAQWTPLAGAILPPLEPLLEDGEPTVRLAAARSWRSLAKDHQRVWPLLIELLSDADRPVRRGASQELQAIVSTAKVPTADLDALFKSPRPEVRSEGTRLLRLHRSRQ